MTRVHVDPSKCQSDNRCFQLAPELFQLDDYGYSHERDNGEVPRELQEKARLAVTNCPERAISFVDEQG